MKNVIVIKICLSLLSLYSLASFILTHYKLVTNEINIPKETCEPVCLIESKQENSITRPFWKWNNISGETMFDFDPFRCHNLVYNTSRKNVYKNIKAGLVLAVTKMNLNYTNYLVEQIRNIRRVTDRDIIILILKKGAIAPVIKKLRYKVDVKFRNVQIKVIELGFQVSQLAKSFVQFQKKNINCCGIAEYIKLEAFRLPYDQILFLDNDVTLVKNPEILFQCDVDFMFTAGSRSPLNAGMFVLKPSEYLYDNMIETLKRMSHTYTNKFCYEGLGCGPCVHKKRKPKEGKNCWGSEGPQGFLPYYFVKRQNPNLKVHQISTCIFNFLSDRLNICRKEEFRTYPYLVHKDLDHKLPTLKEPMILNTPEEKMCRPDFWILGTRKGGTTALYTSIAQHPRVASILLQGTVLDGEALGNVANLDDYNRRFSKAPNNYFVGDSTVYRLVKDTRSITQTCGHKYTKFLILLRDPIERCHSQMLLRARLGISRMDMNSNISMSILKHLNIFNDVTANSTKWVQEPLYPNEKITKTNCISVGIYVAQLKRWFYHASITNFRIYFTRDFQTHTQDVVRDALQFIGISRQEVLNFTLDSNITNDNARPKVKLPPHQQLTPLLRRQLQATFAPYNKMLEEMLDIDLPW